MLGNFNFCPVILSARALCPSSRSEGTKAPLGVPAFRPFGRMDYTVLSFTSWGSGVGGETLTPALGPFLARPEIVVPASLSVGLTVLQLGL